MTSRMIAVGGPAWTVQGRERELAWEAAVVLPDAGDLDDLAECEVVCARIGQRRLERSPIGFGDQHRQRTAQDPASVYPKVATALRFQNVMLPCASVEMIASRADCVTVENRRCDALRRSDWSPAARHVVEGVGHRRGFGAPTGGNRSAPVAARDRELPPPCP